MNKRNPRPDEQEPLRPTQLVQAQPGYRAAYQGEGGFVQTPVVAWSLCSDGTIHALVLGDNGLLVADTVTGFFALLPPDVTDPEHVTDWLAHLYGQEPEDDAAEIELQVVGGGR